METREKARSAGTQVGDIQLLKDHCLEARPAGPVLRAVQNIGQGMFYNKGKNDSLHKCGIKLKPYPDFSKFLTLHAAGSVCRTKCPRRIHCLSDRGQGERNPEAKRDCNTMKTQ